MLTPPFYNLLYIFLTLTIHSFNILICHIIRSVKVFNIQVLSTLRVLGVGDGWGTCYKRCSQIKARFTIVESQTAPLRNRYTVLWKHENVLPCSNAYPRVPWQSLVWAAPCRVALTLGRCRCWICTLAARRTFTATWAITCRGQRSSPASMPQCPSGAPRNPAAEVCVWVCVCLCVFVCVCVYQCVSVCLVSGWLVSVV